MVEIHHRRHRHRHLHRRQVVRMEVQGMEECLGTLDIQEDHTMDYNLYMEDNMDHHNHLHILVGLEDKLDNLENHKVPYRLEDKLDTLVYHKVHYILADK